MTTHFAWPDGCLGNRPLTTFFNVCAGVEHAVEVGFNEFTHLHMARAPFLGGEWRTLNEESIAAIRAYFIEAFHFDPTRAILKDALRHLSWRHRFNPLADQLRALQHDGKERIDQFFIDYASANSNALNRAAGRLFWLSIAARALFPGCDCQTVLILISNQGDGKSTMLRGIAGDPSLFTDQEVVHLSVERQQEALRGRWIVEASELGGFDRQAIEKVKAFLSRTHDRARPAWGTTAVDQPRSFVIVGTSNETEILRDTTGNRRFLPIRVGEIDVAAVSRDRDQLLAEAVALCTPSLTLALPRELWTEAEKRQRAHMLEDPIDEVLSSLAGVEVKGEMRLPIALCWELLSIAPERRTTAFKRRIVDAMRRLGWTYDGRPFRIDSKAHRGFRRPAPRVEASSAPTPSETERQPATKRRKKRK